MGKLLPRLQLLFGVLFAAISLCGPLFFAQGGLVILAAAVSAILLGIVTFYIGWRLVVTKETVAYPFPELSTRIIRLFLSRKEAKGMKPLKRSMPPIALRALGIASLLVGGGLVIVALRASELVMMGGLGIR